MSNPAGWALGEPGSGSIIGTVTESRAVGLATGDVVVGSGPWRRSFCAPAAGLRKVETVEGVPLTAQLGVVGGTGLSAYLPLKHVSGQPNSFVPRCVGAMSGALLMAVDAAGEAWPERPKKNQLERLLERAGSHRTSPAAADRQAAAGRDRAGKTLPLPCVFHRHRGQSLPLPCVMYVLRGQDTALCHVCFTAFAAKTVPFSCGSQVSGAAGAVGSVACQVCKLLGCKVRHCLCLVLPLSFHRLSVCFHCLFTAFTWRFTAFSLPLGGRVGRHRREGRLARVARCLRVQLPGWRQRPRCLVARRSFCACSAAPLAAPVSVSSFVRTDRSLPSQLQRPRWRTSARTGSTCTSTTVSKVLPFPTEELACR